MGTESDLRVAVRESECPGRGQSGVEVQEAEGVSATEQHASRRAQVAHYRGPVARYGVLERTDVAGGRHGDGVPLSGSGRGAHVGLFQGVTSIRQSAPAVLTWTTACAGTANVLRVGEGSPQAAG